MKMIDANILVAGWGTKQIRHCLRITETFPVFKILVSLIRELSNLIESRCDDE